MTRQKLVHDDDDISLKGVSIDFSLLVQRKMPCLCFFPFSVCFLVSIAFSITPLYLFLMPTHPEVQRAPPMHSSILVTRSNPDKSPSQNLRQKSSTCYLLANEIFKHGTFTSALSTDHSNLWQIQLHVNAHRCECIL